MKLTWYGHSAFKIDIDGASILIDPFFTGNPAFPSDLTVESASEGVTHVVLTHGHDDHVGDAIEICKTTGAMITGNYEIALWANAQGIENINPMHTGGKVDAGPFKVALTRADHGSSKQTESGIPIYLGNPNGVIIDAPGEPVLYHMGDTDLFSDMALIDEIHQPKIGIVPIGDRFTMGAKTAAIACTRFLNFDTIIPCHFGTFPIIDQDTGAFMSEMGADAAKVKQMTPGEVVEF